MENQIKPTRTPRFGIHYYPDTLHYREKDLQIWLPAMLNLGVTSVVLISPIERAIPETFIRGLVSAGIEPIIHFKMHLPNDADLETLNLLLSSYASWGVKQVILFDRPNIRSSWRSSNWTQQDLIERFLEEYLPVAHLALACGLIPAFPPLEPGGNYWDTAFLRSSLEGLRKRGEMVLLDQLVIAAYAWSWNHSLNWGRGGPLRWAGVKPYFTPPNEQDQRGFRIFDWYDTICKSVLQKSVPQILLGVGSIGDPDKNPAMDNSESINLHNKQVFTIFKMINGEEVEEDGTGETLGALPDTVASVNFYILSTNSEKKDAWLAWYEEDGKAREIVRKIQSYTPQLKEKPVKSKDGDEYAMVSALEKAEQPGSFHPISHYLLLPRYSWGVSDWHLDVIRPFIKKHSVTVGYSAEEAMCAKRVTVIGNEQSFSDKLLTKLRQSGCEVERIDGDGTTIASTLSMR